MRWALWTDLDDPGMTTNRRLPTREQGGFILKHSICMAT